MRILLFGRNGQVGWELQRALQPLGELRALDRSDGDLLNHAGLRATVHAFRPDIIVNATAYTAVDKAEAEPDLARAVNSDGPRVLAEAAQEIGACLIHYSTDYVFDGEKNGAYVESDATNPVSVYGRTKLEGEIAIAQTGAAHLIFRTSWVYAARAQNFMRTMLRLMHDREELRVVSDQFGAPTSARLIADVTAQVLARMTANARSAADGARERGGIFHLTAAGQTNWFEYACYIRDHKPDARRKLERLLAIPASEYPTPAKRPSNSVLLTDKLCAAWGIHLPHWTESLSLCLAELP